MSVLIIAAVAIIALTMIAMIVAFVVIFAMGLGMFGRRTNVPFSRPNR